MKICRQYVLLLTGLILGDGGGDLDPLLLADLDTKTK